MRGPATLPAKRAADRQYARRRRDDARGRPARRLFDKRPLNHARCPTQWQVRAILRSDQTTGPRCRSEVRNSGQPSRTCRHSHTRNQRGHVARNIQILVRASDRCRHRARGSEPIIPISQNTLKQRRTIQAVGWTSRVWWGLPRSQVSPASRHRRTSPPEAHLLCLANIRAKSLWNSILAWIAFTPSPANALSAGPIYRPPPLDHGP